MRVRHMTPNLFATAALLMWPLVALALYSTRPIGQATLWTILGAYLLLPVGTSIKFEMVPQLDKSSIPNLAALLGCVLVARRSLRLGNGFGLAEVLILALLVGPFITSELNGDAVSVGGRILPGVGHYDALSAVVAQFLFLIPFFLGRQFLRGSADNAEILRVLIVAGLCLLAADAVRGAHEPAAAHLDLRVFSRTPSCSRCARAASGRSSSWGTGCSWPSSS